VSSDLLAKTFELLDKRIAFRCKNEGIKSGTTASCAYITGNRIAQLAWCGDSPISILKSERVVTLSKPHKPEDPEELKRIEENGGMVVSIQGVPRLNGVLNLSRCFGDVDAKPMVSPIPDVTTYEFDSDDYILFLSSDGVWDNLTEEKVFDAVRQFISSNSKDDYTKLSEFVVERAKEAGAQDNLTFISVYLKPFDEIWDKFTPFENQTEKVLDQHISI